MTPEGQQHEMQKTKTYRTDDRIVSISQPHVRLIVRGKVSAATEFGAKIGISVEEGFARCEIISWDAFNEGNTLKEAVERYKVRNGSHFGVSIQIWNLKIEKAYR